MWQKEKFSRGGLMWCTDLEQKKTKKVVDWDSLVCQLGARSCRAYEAILNIWDFILRRMDNREQES